MGGSVTHAIAAQLRNWRFQVGEPVSLGFCKATRREECDIFSYQNGPDTYLLQLRDVDFPVRLREYMKVAVNRTPGSSYIMSDDNGYDWSVSLLVGNHFDRCHVTFKVNDTP